MRTWSRRTLVPAFRVHNFPTAHGSPGALVTKGGLLFVTGGGRVLYAIDSKTGQTVWEHDLGQIAYANPMTYRDRNGRQFVVIATGAGAQATLVAFALPL